MKRKVIFLALAVLICHVTGDLVRKNVEKLTKQEILSLQNALTDASADHTSKGIDAIEAYHGFPPQCKDGDRDVACCVHGSANFPAWHRLFVVQIEQALKDKGLTIGVPYWDWTRQIDHLPELVRDNVIAGNSGSKPYRNPWYEGEIHVGDKVYHTSRAVDQRLYQQVPAGEYTDLFEQVLHAYEYTNFCEFEVHFEIAHGFIHSLVGGRSQYSLSSLDYTAYDPIFFLHHSNVDRLLAIYFEVLVARGIEVDKSEICNIKKFGTPLKPFDSESNPFPVTRENNSPKQTLDYSVYGYQYDSLTLNGLNAADIINLIKDRQSHDRAFADFRLHNIGESADVRVKVCTGSADRDYDHQTTCVHAGDFFILGGSLEMEWSFSRPYHFEITKAVERLGLPLDGNYHVEVDIFSINGTQLASDILPHPSVSFRPASGKTDPPIVHKEDDHDHHVDISVRKNADRLTREEIFQLRDALEKFQEDASVDGYQAIAEFHGDPGKCPFPTAKNRTACCIHGKPTFPHWHRLLVVQVEDALRRRGSPIGIPYWDWTKPNVDIPELASEKDYTNPHNGHKHHNPFHDAEVAFLGNDTRTSRDVLKEFMQMPKLGDHTDLFDAFLFALEQDNFCDFEVQFEIAHNLIHGFVGGSSKYGLSSLSYSAFDPIFYIHHSNIDRIWAIWTALQQHRNKPYKAHCAQSYVHLPLKPFAFSSPYNNNEKTYSHSTPTDVYDYQEELKYTYDSLEFGGMSVEQLDDYINNHIKNKDRVFAEVHLHGIKKSGLAAIYVTPPSGEKYVAGYFGLLGGPSEMPWRFDRTYKHDITQALNDLNLHFSQPYDVTIEIKEFDGTPIDVHTFQPLDVSFEPARAVSPRSGEQDLHVRKNVNQLNPEEVLDLRRALANLEADKSSKGYQTLGRFHGAANWCPSPEAQTKVACCLHGMPTFPHWHRLLVVQAENALRDHDYHGGLPYWDWTKPLTSLPDIVSSQTYIDPTNGNKVENPFYSAHIDDVNQNTTRSIRPDLFQQPQFGEYTPIAEQVLLAFEQENFCDFEIQFEIAHNFIHALVGGSDPYSMASLAYTAYDPLFYLHHSNTDRLWAVWQTLQKYRGKPYNSANCAVNKIHKALAPFSLSSDVNPDPVTREHSFPLQIFDYKTNFHYVYDNLEFNGLSISQLARVLDENKAKDRVFVGFLLHGIQHSALAKFHICKKDDDCDYLAGEFYLLGDEHEMEWTADRLYKYDITKQLKNLGLHYDDRYTIKYEIHDLDGTDLGQPFPAPTVIHEVGASHIYRQEYRPEVTAASHIRHNLDSLSPGEIESLRSAFLAIQKDRSYEKIASFHGKPGLCEFQGRKVACCVHGSPAFPAWHRLYVEQVEHALLDHGSSVAVPYWDWTSPITKLPSLINNSTYYNSRNQRFYPNPFFSGKITGEEAVTTRDPQPELFNNDYFYEQALFALEQDNFCDFEIQFEILHNALHSWLGGHAKYSLSSLDYTAFDPVFFLHHANTDRIWAIWQELQHYRGLSYNEADCAINFMRKPLNPFAGGQNTDKVTQRYSHPADTFDYRNHFEYEYDDLEFNHLTIPQLENLIKQHQKHGRIFAGFMIHNIGTTADVHIKVCISTSLGPNNCNIKAGVFSILGGDSEMPFAFDRLYKHEITKTINGLGLNIDTAIHFELKIEIIASNGNRLDSHILQEPTIIYVPGEDGFEDDNGIVSPYLVRKNINTLSPLEGYHLLKALTALKADNSADGFQSIAAFHALPPLCPSPTDSERFACCIHGAASFLQWHRLYTVQFEEALRRHGSIVGVPYWDWTRVIFSLPRILTVENYTDDYRAVWAENPFIKSRIEFENTETERDLQTDNIFEIGPHGWDTWLYNQAVYALEQEDFCDFSIQLEITHNSIHSWLGGSKEHSMAHLHYASYDPAFYIHHSNTDRLWALWQALQKHRGHDPNEVNCALEKLRVPLKPFSFGPPYNLNTATQFYSNPEDTLNYKEHFNYEYDTLEFVGMPIPQLDAHIKDRQEHDRVFAGFLLKGLGRSVNVEFEICSDVSKLCFPGGHFSILGGSAEMPWQFDRLYKYEITDQLKEQAIEYDDEYHFHIYVKDIDGTELDRHLIPDPSVIFEAGNYERNVRQLPVNHIRRDLYSLKDRDILSLQSALHDLQEDTTNDGWTNLASFHGAPARCPDLKNSTVACCHHGMPTFPHWHRLYTLQVEHALRRHGSSIAIPYWDWTFAMTKIPSILAKADYYDAWRNEVLENPFAHGYIPSKDVYTVRDYHEKFITTIDGVHSVLFNITLVALEQTNFCDFEVHFEVAHNAFHFIVGGNQKYSMSSLEYSAYDPIFFFHHSFTDKVWIVWQKLQQKRYLPYDRADCAVNSMNEPMKPFNFEGFNLNKFTRKHAVPNTLFDHEDLGYGYDNFNIGGYTPDELEDLINEKKKHPRVFAGFLLKGIKTSVIPLINICKGDGTCYFAGRLTVLGGPTESPWAYDRIYKREITEYFEAANLRPDDIFNASLNIHLKVITSDINYNVLSEKESFLHPTLIYEPAHTVESEDKVSKSVAGVAVRKDVSKLTTFEVQNLRYALSKVKKDSGPNGFQELASFHGSPPKCDYNNHLVACCIHGMANFPQWHRLYIKQWEDALIIHDAKIGIPYWDWTTAFTELPELVTDKDNNPFHHGKIYNGKITTRAPQDKLFDDPDFETESFFYRQILLAFEQTDYCDFEVQFEITHNAIHSWTGGQSLYGMSTLEYTAYDPLFLLHHSNVDRQFAIWQALQKFRGLPYNEANCAIQLMHQPMRPFSDASNTNPTTKAHSRASDAFNYHK